MTIGVLIFEICKVIVYPLISLILIIIYLKKSKSDTYQKFITVVFIIIILGVLHYAIFNAILVKPNYI